eukprot:scaffold225489_cov17-Tisochrysis_lutea.AAC.1
MPEGDKDDALNGRRDNGQHAGRLGHGQCVSGGALGCPEAILHPFGWCSIMLRCQILRGGKGGGCRRNPSGQ